MSAWWLAAIARTPLQVDGAEAQPEAADVSEDTAQKVAMFCVSNAGIKLLEGALFL